MGRLLGEELSGAVKTGQPERKKQYVGIQALRFVAALLVVITHSTFYAQERLDPGAAVWGFGAIGVHIFFTISGFVLIGSAGSLSGVRDGWKRFAMGRIVRVAPMYWIATTLKLTTMVVVPGAVLHAALDPQKVLLSYLFLPSRNVDGHVEPLLGVGWTLTFEMFFYAIFTLALLLRANPLLFGGAVLAFVALGNLLRVGTDWPAWAVYFDPIVLYFLIGMAIARVTQSSRAMRFVPYVAGACGAVTAAALLSGVEMVAMSNHPLIFILVTGIVLAVMWVEPLVAGRIPKFVLFMGAASYSLYLFHPLVAPIVPEILRRVGVTYAPLSVVLSILAAVVASAVIYRWVEKPLTGWLQSRLPYVRKPVLKRTR